MRISQRLTGTVTILLAIMAAPLLAATIYVDVNAPGGGTGGSSDPLQTLGAAIPLVNAAGAGSHLIYMADGAYKDVANGGLEDYSVAANYTLGIATDWAGTEIKGGYAGYDGVSAYDWTTRVLMSTVLDGTSANARFLEVVQDRKTTRINGITFQNATASSDGGAILKSGSWQSNLIVEDCRFENNKAGGNGGGAISLAVGGRSTDAIRRCEFDLNGSTAPGSLRATSANQAYGINIEDCEFLGNQALSGTGDGGAIGFVGFGYGPINVRRCLFLQNSANDQGGAVCFYRDGDALFERCEFIGNRSGDAGAAIGTSEGYHMEPWDMVNCLVIENTGGVAVQYMSKSGNALTLDHVTLADNPNGGVYGQQYSSSATTRLYVKNSIIANNGPFGIKLDNFGGSTYSDVYGHTADYVGLTADTGDISVDPVFFDAANDDYRLGGGSPCLDAADPASTVTEDFNATTRPINSVNDMGAYEGEVLPPCSFDEQFISDVCQAYTTMRVTSLGQAQGVAQQIAQDLVTAAGAPQNCVAELLDLLGM